MAAITPASVPRPPTDLPAPVCQTSPVPEILEVELTRRGVAPVVGRRVESVERTDPLVVGDGVDIEIVGSVITGLDRVGKQLVVLTDGPTVGVHLGMTGRLLVDDISTIGELAYGAGSDAARWDRWVLALSGGMRLRLHDPRRFARVVLDADLSRLGPDALTLRRRALAAVLAGRKAPLKAVLLDQHAIAGLGNMLVDEVLWSCGLDPRRVAGGLTDEEIVNLHRTIRRRLVAMMRRGGSHTGRLSPSVRAPGGVCARDGTPLARAVVGGRTTVWCPQHQR